MKVYFERMESKEMKSDTKNVVMQGWTRRARDTPKALAPMPRNLIRETLAATRRGIILYKYRKMIY